MTTRNSFLYLLLAIQLSIPGIMRAQTSGDDHSHQDLVTINTPSAPRENFADPRLKPSELKQSIALMLERAEFPTYTRELWHVEWRADDPIDLYIIRPKGIVNPAVILYLYGYPSDSDRFHDDAYCQLVTARGSAAVGFVSALTGARYHDRPWKEWFISDLPEALGTTTHDVQMILNFLESQPDLDHKRVGMFGQGSGATIAAISASVDPRIRAVDLLDPWGDWGAWLKTSPALSELDRSALSTPESQSELRELDPIRSLPLIEPQRVRLQQTDFSPETPRAVQQAIASKLPTGSQSVRYKTIDDYKAEAADKGMILEWLNARLKSAK